MLRIAVISLFFVFIITSVKPAEHTNPNQDVADEMSEYFSDFMAKTRAYFDDNGEKIDKMKADFDSFKNRTSNSFKALYDENVPQDKIDEMKSDFENFKERTSTSLKDFFSRNMNKAKNTTINEMKDRM